MNEEKNVKLNKIIITAIGIGTLAGIALTLNNEPASANENIYATMTDKEFTDEFGDIKDNENVLVLPEGGLFYGGELKTINEKTNEVISVVNSNTDKNAISFGEFKNRMRNSEIKPQIQQSFDFSLPLPSTKGAKPVTGVKVLKKGEIYNSNAFSGSGWRFAGTMFRAADGTGNGLRWTAIKDDGRVGTYNEAYSQYCDTVGRVHGYALYVSSGKTYLPVNNGGVTYYTYNPKAGTKYRVENN